MKKQTLDLERSVPDGLFEYVSFHEVLQGLRYPVNAPEYRRAMIGLQRLTSPIIAGVLPCLFVLCMMLLSGEQQQDDDRVIEVVYEEVTPYEQLKKEEPLDQPKMDQPNLELPELPDVGLVVKVDAPVESRAVKAPTMTDALPIMKSPLILKGISARAVEGVGLGGDATGGGQRLDSDLTGTLYDYKRDGKGNPRNPDYWRDLKSIIDKRISPAAFAPFYKVEKTVYLSHLLVPKAKAESGPESFGVGSLMQPKQWIAHYTGPLQPRESGTYRFVGNFDDAMVIVVNGRVILESCWEGDAGSAGPVTGWQPKVNVGTYRCFTGRWLTYGDWFELDSRKPVKVDLFVGERPGGLISGVLLIEQKGKTYQKEANGRDILPIFSTSVLSIPERERIHHFKDLAIESLKIPVMNTLGEKEKKLGSITDGDIKVDTGNL